MATYGDDITTEALQQQFINEVSNETLIPEKDLPSASFPEFSEDSDESNNDVYGFDGAIVPSGIPSAIDKLWKYNNKVQDTDPPVSPVLKLKNEMKEDYTLTDNYNGLCLNLVTIGHNLIVEEGSVLLAL